MKRWIPLIIALCLAALALAEQKKPVGVNPTDSKSLTVNQLTLNLTNDGNFFKPNTSESGLLYPTGAQAKPIICMGGLSVVGKVNGEIRTGYSRYSGNYQPGSLGADGVPADPSDAKYHVYAYAQGEPPSQDALALGCPNPVLGNAMLFTVFNDASGAKVRSLGPDPNYSPHLGLEVRQTAFAFGSAGLATLDLCTFVRYEVIYRGTETVDSAYVSLFIDPDLGYSSDDVGGTDTLRQMVYAWNGDDADEGYFGTAIPAVGAVQLEGPVPMTSSYYEVAFDIISGMTGMRNSAETWNAVGGLRNDGLPWEPSPGQTTTYPFAGDPIAGTGWLYAEALTKCDTRINLTSGPQTLQPGDTLRYTYAFVVGQPGATALDAVQNLRDNVDAIKTYYDDNLCKTTAVEEPLRPKTLELLSAYPNPFNPQTTLQVRMEKAASVKLEIFDIRGRKVATLNDGLAPAGKSKWIWNAGDLPSGLYLCRATLGRTVRTQKLLLQK